MSLQKCLRAIELCLNDQPDKALNYLESLLQEDPKLATYSYFKYARAYAFATKGGLVQKFVSSLGVIFALHLEKCDDENTSESTNQQFEFSSKQLVFLEKALQEIMGIEDFRRFVGDNIGFIQDLIDNDEFERGPWEKKGGLLMPLDEAIGYVLEKYRPGRVQQITGKTRLRYFGPHRFQLHEDGRGVEEFLATKEPLAPFLDVDITFWQIFKSAMLIEAGKDEEGRRHITLALSGTLEPFDEKGCARTVGLVRLFDDGTVREVGLEDIAPLSEKKEGTPDYFQAALTFFNSGRDRDDETLFKINKALELGLSIRKEAVAHYIRGTIYFRRKQLPEAEQEFKKALELDETVGEPLAASSVFTSLASIYEKKGQINLAIETLENAVYRQEVLFQKDAWAISLVHKDLAWLYRTHRDAIPSAEENAFMNFQIAYRMNPNLLDVMFMLGVIHNEEGKFHDPQKAIQHYKQFLRLTKGQGTKYEEFRKIAVRQLESLGSTAPRTRFFCQYCGAQIQGDAVYCERCGKKIT